VTTDFDPSLYAIKQMKQIKLERLFGQVDYIGMVNKNDQPHGWGRAVNEEYGDIIDAQWKDGVLHGYFRMIN
jgi:hypothetical protein